MHKQKRWECIGELLTMLLGVIGTAGCFLSAFPMEYSRLLLTLGLGTFSLVLYYAYFGHKAMKKLLLGGYVAMSCLTYFYWSKAVPYLINTVLVVYENNSQYHFRKLPAFSLGNRKELPLTLALFVLFVPMCVCMIHSLRKKRGYLAAFLISAVFLGSILLFTLRPHPLYFLMALTYAFILWGMANGKRHIGDNVMRSGWYLGLCAFLLMIGIWFAFPQQEYIRSETVESVRARIQMTIRDMVQKDRQTKDPGELDLSKEGDRYYLYQDDLIVEMEEPRTLYLHGYSATFYRDNTWKQMNRERYRMLYDIQGKLQVHPFSFVREQANKYIKQGALHRIKVENQHGDDRYLYVPYAVNDDLSSLPLVLDTYIDASEMEDEQEYHIWDEQELVGLPAFDAVLQYEKAFREAYLDVPAALADELANVEILNLRQDSTREEKIAAIQNYMLHFGTYTLTPGTTPKKEDFILYFLTNRKSGYCVHYASAAVMLLRYYGVTARYASGYVVDAASFKDKVAKVKDSQAHAWVEVLDPAKGWVVLEVTPSASSATAGSSTTQGQTNLTTTDSQTTIASSPHQNAPVKTGDKDVHTSKSDAITISAKWLFWGAVILLLAALPLRRSIIWHRRRRAMQDSDTQKAILACGAYLSDLQITRDSMDLQVRRILEEAKFSDHEMKEAQRILLHSYCESAKKQRQSEGSFIRRLYERYIKCVI